MRYANPHQQYGTPQMNPIQNSIIAQQQQQAAQLQQQLMQQQLQQQMMNPAMQQQQLLINMALQRNPQAAMMVQQNPSLLSNPQFIQQLLSTVQQVQQVQQPMMQPQMQTTMQQGLLQQQQQMTPQLQTDGYSGRFGGQQTAPQVTQQPQQQQVTQVTEPTPQPEPVQVSKSISEFVVETIPVPVYNNTKFTITPKTGVFNPAMVEDHGVIGADSFLTALESLIEKSGSSKKDAVFSTISATIHNTSFTVPVTENYIKLFTGDVRQLYKTLKVVYNEIKTVDDLIMANNINQHFTVLVNHYLKINLDNAVDISSFVEDFNDLLKVLRSNFEDAEDDLRDYVQEEMEEIKEIFQSRPEERNKDFYLTEGVTIVYYADHHYALGLKGVSDTVQIANKVSNQLLINMAKHVFTDSQRNEFYLRTYDQNLYVFSINKEGQVFVEGVELN